MREDLKGRNLSFTEMAKLVGENWQNLTPEEKEPYETQAQRCKDKYLAELAEYKKTPEYRKYQEYLREFREKHGSPSQGELASSTPSADPPPQSNSNVPWSCRQGKRKANQGRDRQHNEPHEPRRHSISENQQERQRPREPPRK